MKCIKWIVALLLLMQLVGCWDESFSTDPRHQLSFNSDTLSFDTVFANVPTPTKWTIIHNRNAKPLLIETITLNEGNKGFRLNIDGISGEAANNFTSIEIGAKDSLFILVEVTPKLTGQNTPTEVTDKLIFTVNGERQELVLAMNVWDVDLWRGKVIDANYDHAAGSRPVVVYDSLYIAEGAKFTIGEGCRFFFHTNAFVLVDGTIIANGTSQQPITFQGDRLDDMLVNFPYDRMPGQWKGFKFNKPSYDNSFSHCVVRATDYAMVLDSSALDRQKITLENCLLQNATYNLFSATHCKTVVMGCEFSNGGESSVMLLGGNHQFIHSTIVSYAPWGSGGSTALYIGNSQTGVNEETVPYPLTSAQFVNCIVGGKSSDELLLAKNKDTTIPYSVTFKRVLIKGKPLTNDALFEDILWWNSKNNDPKFALTGNGSEYLFDFRLTKESAAIAKGVTDFINNTTDFYGNSRLLSPNADLGAFQYIENTAK